MGEVLLPTSEDMVFDNRVAWGLNPSGNPTLELWANDHGITVPLSPETLKALVEGLQEFMDSPQVQAYLYLKAVNT